MQTTTTNATKQHSLGSARQPGYKFVGDRELSTYRWVIWLNNDKQTVIEGYSKDVNSCEKEDKQQLLQDCISRLGNKGYLDKCYYWVIFKRQFTHKDTDTMILELNPHGYLAHDSLTLDISTLSWLDRLFTARKTNTQGILNYKDLLPQRLSPQQIRKADFEFTLERFPTKNHLGDYCRNVLLAKYGRNQVLAWYNAKEVIYSTSQQQPIAGAVVAGGNKDNERAAQLAQTAMMNLQARFTRGK
ncbi:hypothetical protein GO755_07730 [Spirosoma sp. HMF4905]|uniref:Uncharacterized protein n=1 Tax=Spirosoma arboris TaxID=2682092 RepID=A0A7K1S8F5_9BACT|nr:hypothetical protein [Spirosoma arboris]MVM29918.1 hypothetical protein [Spirosoma arboris]